MIINENRVFKILINVLFVLFIANLAAVSVEILYGTDNYIYSFLSKWDFDTERNFPTFFSSINLLFSSFLLSIIAVQYRSNGESWRLWMGLALLFAFLCFDEFISIHELLTRPTREFFNTTGSLYFAWIIPYSLLAVVIGLIYLRFLLRLPRNTRYMFILSAFLLLFGAIVIESFGAKVAYNMSINSSSNKLLWYISYTFEETLEMLGVIVFIRTLVKYIRENFTPFTIRFIK